MVPYFSFRVLPTDPLLVLVVVFKLLPVLLALPPPDLVFLALDPVFLVCCCLVLLAFEAVFFPPDADPPPDLFLFADPPALFLLLLDPPALFLLPPEADPPAARVPFLTPLNIVASEGASILSSRPFIRGTAGVATCCSWAWTEHCVTSTWRDVATRQVRMAKREGLRRFGWPMDSVPILIIYYMTSCC